MAITVEPTFRVKFRSNIRQHIRWLEHMVSPEWAAQILKSYQSASNLAKLQRIARKVIQEEIYDKYSPEGSTERTGDAKRSFVAVQLSGEHNGIGVRSDPSVAQTKGPVDQGSESDFSYAAFFDEPNFNSFLPPGKNLDVYSPRKFRPFMEPLTGAVEEFAKEAAMRATIRAVTQRMPRSRAINDNG